MKIDTVVILVDYQKRFSTKWAALPYRSGMDLAVLTAALKELGYTIEVKSFSEIDFRHEITERRAYLFGSSEDNFLLYKSYIEDVIYGLKLKGALLLTPYELLKAHHNKVFMEVLRDLSTNNKFKNIESHHFGTLEEFKDKSIKLDFPIIIKSSAGASSLGVQKANTISEAYKKLKKIARSKHFWSELWDIGRALKHKGYKRESKHRNKFVVQNMMPDLTQDWKILVFGTKYYILERSAKKGDFRASGSGILKYPDTIPNGLLDVAKSIFDSFDTPFLGMDIGLSEGAFVLIEFQGIHFGTHTLDTSPFYYEKKKKKWIRIERESILEKEVAISVDLFLSNYDAS